MIKKLTAKATLLTICDEGKLSTKEACKILKLDKGRVNTMFYSLRKSGWIEHCGYNRYQLTEEGKGKLRQLMSKDPTRDNGVVEYGGGASPQPIPAKPTKPDNWETRYWQLLEDYKKLAITTAGGRQ